MIAAAASIGVYGNDWPVWRGPNQNGVSEESGWKPKNAEVSWTKELGDGYSAVSVKGDRLYTMGHKPVDEKQGEDVVYCLNAKTGGEIWSYAYPASTGEYKGPRATPVLDGDRLYTVSQDGQVICFDATAGNVIWQMNVLTETGNKNIKWGISSSAVFVGDLILLNVGDSGTALKKSDGSIVWKSEGTASYASPVVFDHKGRKLAAVFSAPGLQVVDALTGEKIASVEWKTSYDINGADPLVIGEKIFISSGYKKGCAMFDFSSGSLEKVWENDLMRNQFSSSVYFDGQLYGVDGQVKSKGALRCISAADGSEKWNETVGFASLMAADGKLIILNEEGTLLFVEISPDGYRELSRIETGLSKLCWTAPVLANGMIYCRNDKGTLVAVDVSK
ncbi:MAG: PQQ-binding-like beta-propeller repeat protein [Pontiellaceae bacterium]|nr:PQQ-binding-like beta-propeller repeat protein [Pontiellaceae bacterium]